MLKSEELRENLIKIFSLPFQYIVKEEKKYLNMVTEDKLKEYKSLVFNCLEEALKLMVAYKKAELKSEWNCSVTGFNGLSVLLTNLINTSLEQGHSHRQQVILVCRVFFALHIANLDIEVRATPEGKRMSIAILDAVNDTFTYQLALIPAFKKLKKDYSYVDNVFYTDECIQYDLLTCPVFGVDIANQLRKTPDLHALLNTMSDADGKVKWSDLPLPLLKKAQSVTLLTSLKDKGTCNKKLETTEDYLKKHSGFFVELPSKMRNFAIIDFYLKYADKLLPIIQASSAEDLVDIIEGKKDFPIQTNHISFHS